MFHPLPPWSHAEDWPPRLVELALTQLPRPEPPPLREPLEREAVGFERDGFDPKLAPDEAPLDFDDLARLDFTELSAPRELPVLCRERVPWTPVAAVTSPSDCP